MIEAPRSPLRGAFVSALPSPALTVRDASRGYARTRAVVLTRRLAARDAVPASRPIAGARRRRSPSRRRAVRARGLSRRQVGRLREPRRHDDRVSPPRSRCRAGSRCTSSIARDGRFKHSGRRDVAADAGRQEGRVRDRRHALRRRDDVLNLSARPSLDRHGARRVGCARSCTASARSAWTAARSSRAIATRSGSCAPASRCPSLSNVGASPPTGRRVADGGCSSRTEARTVRRP